MIARVEQWLRWPLWSWRNLIVSSVAVLVVFTAVGRLTAGSDAKPDSGTRNVAATPAPTSPAESVTSPPVTATTPAVSTPLTPTTSGSAPEAPTGTKPIASPSSTAAPGPDARTATRIALDFTTAWTRTTLAQPAWVAGLKSLVTAEYLAALSTVDPAHVPATRILDSGRLLSTSGQQSLVQVATDGGGVTVTLVLRAGQWLVADVEPAEPPRGATTPPLTPATGTTAAR